ncbi:MAG: TetR/AcrR family transcriptional regulator [Oceanicoccus sp.]
MKPQKARTRLSPDLRKNQLLDTAKEMIIAGGLQRFTMEALARAASVSSPLVYKYFSSRDALLQELLEREHAAFSNNMTEKLRTAKDFSEVVRAFINSNFDHHTPGNILPALLNEPEIAKVVEKIIKKSRQQSAVYLVENAAGNYKLTKSQAELVISMSSGASIAAASYCKRSRASREECIETALSFVLAGLEKISKQQK